MLEISRPIIMEKFYWPDTAYQIGGNKPYDMGY